MANVGGTESSDATPTDSVEVRSNTSADTDPMLTGVRDMMLGQVQARAGAALLHAYSENRKDLFDLLKD